MLYGFASYKYEHNHYFLNQFNEMETGQSQQAVQLIEADVPGALL